MTILLRTLCAMTGKLWPPDPPMGSEPPAPISSAPLPAALRNAVCGKAVRR